MDEIERAIGRYAVKRLPGNTACVVDLAHPDKMAEFCNDLDEARRLLTTRQAETVRAVVHQ